MKLQIGCILAAISAPFVAGTPLQSEAVQYPPQQLGLDQILSPAELGVPLQFHPSDRLSQWNMHKIFVALASPENLRAVLESGTVLFDTSDLDLGMTRAAPVVVQLAKDYMRHLEFSIRYFIYAETQADEAQQRMRSYIETLRQTPAFDIRGLNRYREYFSVIPQRAQLVSLTVGYLGKTFDTEVLEYIRRYFTAAAQVDMDTARKLRKVLDVLQAEYSFLPSGYFEKVQSVIDDAVVGVAQKKYK